MIFESFGKVECELQHGELTFSKQILGSRNYGQLKYCNGNEKFNACSSRVSWMRAQMMFDWKDWYIVEKVISRIVR